MSFGLILSVPCGIAKISFLIIPTTIYLVFLVPKLSEEYNILMTSGGVLGAFGYYGSTRIPDKLKYSGIVKMASKSYTTVVVGLLIQEFLPQIIGVFSRIIAGFWSCHF